MATVTPVQIPRHKWGHYLNITPAGGTPTLARINLGSTDLSVSPNPETESQHWIGEESGSTYVKSYAPTIDAEQIAYKGDPVFDFVFDIYWKRKILSDAETDYYEVLLFEESSSGEYEAQKQRVCISVGTVAGPATDPVSISYTINFMGDPTYGTLNPQTKTFNKTTPA